MPDSPGRLLAVGRGCSFVLYGLMILGLCAWQLIRPAGPLYVIWLIQLLPLLIFLPGMLRDSSRAYIGLCFVLLLYFIKSVEGVFSTARTWIDFWLLSGSVILFISAMMTSRWLQQAQMSRDN